jgi:1L-myo-inositol 1-phosphate cytidylyltransferase / CDP-L-myo-inositol myo-inositolphosphotransferase
VYCRWLRAHGRGDLLAFQWEFEVDEGDSAPSPLSRGLSATRYLFRKDFIVFAAFVIALAGYLPFLLFALAPGNLVVAISVLIQQARLSRTSPPS